MKISTIAELLVKIGANNDGLKSKLSESESAIQKALSANPVTAFTDSISGVTNGISGVIGKMSGLVALTAGGFGLGAIIDNAVNAGESVYQLSTKFGITAKEASELSRILKLTGGDTQTFSTAMLRLDKAYSSSGESGDKCRAVLDATGVTLKDSSGKLLPLNQQLENLSKGYKLAAASGQQEEFIMNTLGARGMALVGTLKNLAEAKEDAAKVTGAGLDPQKMHDLKRELDVISLQSTQVGLALTGALAPIATELFPPIMNGLKGTAEFLVANKTAVIDLTEDALQLVAAYKGIQLAVGASSAISSFWTKAALDATASSSAQILAAGELSIAQERAIARTVAASNKGYTKMQADAVKAAQAMGLSAEETAVIITEKSVQIATESASTAEAIRTQMTAAFLRSSTAATEFATVANTAIASTGIAATEAAAVKTAATSESAELCAAAVAGSSASQVTAIETVAAASALAAEQSVTASATMAEAAAGAKLAQTELAIATALPGDAAIVASGKTVGAMATAEAAVISLSKSVWTLMGGWLGLIAIMGYGAYKAYQYGGQVYDNYTKAYGVKPDNYELSDSFHGQPVANGAGGGIGDFKRDENSNTLAPVESYEVDIPKVDLTGIAGMSKGKTAAEKELEKLRKKAEQVNKEIDRAYQESIDNKIERADDWYKKEKAKLDESAAANSRYTEVLSELDSAYAEKKRKAYAEMLSNSTNIWIEAAKGQRELNDLVSTAGITGVQRQMIQLQNQYNDALAETIEKYKKESVAFMGKDKESRTQYLLANPDVKVNEDGSLNFTNRINAENLAHTKEYEQQKKDLHAESTRFQEDLDRAYSDYSFTELQTLLNSESAIQNQYRSGQTALMQEYYATWRETHKSSMETMAEAAGSLQNGMSDMFSEVFQDVNNASDAVKAFGKTVIKTIADIYAKRMAANISISLLDSFLGTTTLSGSRPAGVSGPVGSNGGFYLQESTGGYTGNYGSRTVDHIPSLLTAGEFVLNSDATSSIGLENLNYMNDTGNIPGYAIGGYVTGPSLASISSGYSSATTSRSGGSAGGSINITINNNSSSQVTATDGGILDGVRQLIFEIAPDATLDKASRNTSFARNFTNALGA